MSSVPPSSAGSTGSPVRVVAALIERDGRYLVTQRRATAVLPLYWEFPGGKVEPGESDADALRREVAHRVGVEVAVGEAISSVVHAYERYAVELVLYQCMLGHGDANDPVPRAVAALCWVSSGEMDGLPFTPADEASVAKLLGLEPME
jgi:8-oxo-dGTP diphosphatase